MFYREPAHKSTRRIVLAIGIPLVLILVIILTMKYTEAVNRNNERKIALNFMGDILETADKDGSFTLTDAGQYQYIRLFYELSYDGEYDDFVTCSIDFCSSVNGSLYAKYPELNEHPRLVSWQDDFLLCIFTADGEYYFNYDKEYHLVRTNVFLEDYSIFENMDRIDKLYVNTYYFTEEQREQLESSADGYSFEIFVNDRLVIRKNSIR